MTETEALLALNLLPLVGPVRVRRMLEHFDSPADILRASRQELLAVHGIGREMAETIATWESRVDLSRELRRIREVEATILPWSAPEYPAALRQIHSPPLVLYVRGKLEERDRHSIGIVGSRRATHYGRDCARKFSFQLAQAGLTVISGLALGIDTFAHEGALAAQGRTVAVIGSGLGRLYPPENAGLADKIASSGAIVTEFPVDYPPDKQSFPLRNRIVAGWGKGLLVIEAPIKSGSLITAGQALEEGRNLYAIPGQIDKPTSHGTNKLIQQGAKLVLDGQDILEDYELLPGMSKPTSQDEMDFSGSKIEVLPAQAAPVVLSEVEEKILSLMGGDEWHIDDLAGATGLPHGPLSAQLMRLEMKRLIRALPGKWFARRS